jgi:hypothetical protein
MRSSWSVALLLACAFPGAAQQAAVLGIVRDTTSTRPLIGAVVTLRGDNAQRTTRTDERGEFAIYRVPFGTYTVTVQRLGYEPAQRAITVVTDLEPLAFALSRVTQLDTVRVRAARQAIYGFVGTFAHHPIAGSAVQLYGASFAKTRTDSNGRFFLELKTPGVYLVRARASGYSASAVSVTLPPNDGVEVALVLDSASGSANRLEHAFADFNDRMIRVRPTSSALIGRKELTSQGNSEMLFAIKSSPSFARKVFRFTDTACLFVDGLPRPGESLSSVEPEDVEVVEVYTARGDASGTLMRAWPAGQPCGPTGSTWVAPGTDIVKYVSIWLKH